MQYGNLQSKISNLNKGFIFLEIIIAVALVSIVFIALLGIGFSSMNILTSLQKASQADALMKEEFEAIRIFRDGSTWASTLGSLSVGSANPYYLMQDNSTNPPSWVSQTGSEVIGIFTRQVVFDKVSRDPATNHIEGVYNASHDDPDTRKATVTISWPNHTSLAVAYFTNWQK